MTSPSGGYRRVATENRDDDDDQEDMPLRVSSEKLMGSAQIWLQSVIDNIGFQSLIGCVIAINAAVIGLETDNPDYWMWPALEDIFLCVFVCELCLRLFAFGCGGFFSLDNPEANWNYFDFVIVSVGLTDRLCTIAFGHNNHTKQAKLVGMLMRSFRLMRILRIFKIFRVLKQLYLLASGFIDAMASAVWVTVLCALILYICSIMMVRLVGTPPPDDPYANFKEEHFGSVGISMLTLFQLMAYPDMKHFERLYMDSIAMCCFLIGFVIFGQFTVVSILSGVISESMMERSKGQADERKVDQERQRGLFVRQARKVLQAMDRTGSGFLERSAFERCSEEILTLCKQEYIEIKAQDLDAMFDLVDYQSSGTIEIEELLYGLLQLTADVRPMSIMELRRIVMRGLHGTNRQIAAIDARTKLMDDRICELLAAFRANPAVASAAPSASSASPAPLADGTNSAVSAASGAAASASAPHAARADASAPTPGVAPPLQQTVPLLSPPPPPPARTASGGGGHGVGAASASLPSSAASTLAAGAAAAAAPTGGSSADAASASLSSSAPPTLRVSATAAAVPHLNVGAVSSSAQVAPLVVATDAVAPPSAHPVAASAGVVSSAASVSAPSAASPGAANTAVKAVEKRLEQLTEINGAAHGATAKTPLLSPPPPSADHVIAAVSSGCKGAGGALLDTEGHGIGMELTNATGAVGAA